VSAYLTAIGHSGAILVETVAERSHRGTLLFSVRSASKRSSSATQIPASHASILFCQTATRAPFAGHHAQRNGLSSVP
jgi:hypothetical protein